MELAILIIQGLILLGIAVFYLLMKYTLPNYLKEKGKNIATKEDIAEITKKIETVKVELNKMDRINEKKYEIKYLACLKALEIIDAIMSHTMGTDNDKNPITIPKQYSDEETTRKCHNELLLSVDNQELIKIFLEIIVNKSPDYPYTESLNKVRSLIRGELGFEGEFYEDKKNTWVAIVGCKKSVD